MLGITGDAKYADVMALAADLHFRRGEFTTPFNTGGGSALHEDGAVAHTERIESSSARTQEGT